MFHREKIKPQDQSAPVQEQSRNVDEGNAAKPDQPETQIEKDSKTMNAEAPVQKQGNEPSQGPQQAAPASRPAAYPGAYPGATAAYTPQNANESASQGFVSTSNSQNRLVISKGITLSGEIESCEHLVVEGTVEAALKGASILDIAESGAFYGTVEIDQATVAGRFEGDLTVRGRLTVKSGGSITGAIAYKELAVEAGATIDGTISPLDAQAKAAAGNSRKIVGAKTQKTANSGNELPFDGKTAAAAE